ncbi:MAG TPA: PKD domain-containing protein, partial [Gemmatimonadaceae bacterium]|nr:PKD domain-containing protein [Gemmatimonadaceae bacterium]
NASASQPTKGVTGFYWSFGDGTTATGQKVTHTYASTSSYTWHVSIATGTGKKYLTTKAILPQSAAGSSTNIVPYYVP